MAEGLESLRLMVVAGEESGDAHAAALVRALRECAPATRFEFFGSTGARLREAVVESVVREDDLAITGLVEIARALPRFAAAYRALKRAALERRPDAVVLVDWPDFNLALARTLRRRGLKIIYYISPQLWAWRSHRVRQVRRDVDLMLTILPFERDWYAARGVAHVEFVGHPLAGRARPHDSRAEFCARHDLDPSKPVVALLAGSRRKEFERILPVMLDAAARVSQTTHGAQFSETPPGARRPNLPGDFVSEELRADCTRFLEAIHALVGRRAEMLGAKTGWVPNPPGVTAHLNHDRVARPQALVARPARPNRSRRGARGSGRGGRSRRVQRHGDARSGAHGYAAHRRL